MADIDKLNYTHHKAQRDEWQVTVDEHDELTNAKRVKIVDGALTIENADVNIGDVGLVNINGQDINPATEESQQLIVQAINSGNLKKTKRLDDTSVNGLLFIGEAPVGSNEDDSIWRISVLDESTSVVKILFADGNDNFDNDWSNRLNLTYQ